MKTLYLNSILVSEIRFNEWSNWIMWCSIFEYCRSVNHYLYLIEGAACAPSSRAARPRNWPRASEPKTLFLDHQDLYFYIQYWNQFIVYFLLIGTVLPKKQFRGVPITSVVTWKSKIDNWLNLDGNINVGEKICWWQVEN